MAATFIFKLGTLDLSQYIRVNPDDHMDPYGAPWLTPAFTETPFADGQPLISTTVGNRESMWPMFLSEPSKDLLHALIQSINVAAGQKPLVAEWRDDSASKSTFMDITFLRFEPDFNFRRSVAGFAAGVLHVWSSGYSHTGTTRVGATAAGTGVFLNVPMPSIAGDAPALLDTTISGGAVVPTLGRIVGLAAIPHPSYAALIPAASLLSPQAGATLRGASGMQGSQCLALPVSATGGASGIACKVPLGNPTIMGGDNRILTVVKSGISGGIGITALDPYGNAMGPTAVASNSNGLALVDLGVCRLPTVGFPTRPEISIVAGALWASGAAGPAILGSPGLSINEVICLPDKSLTLVLESGQVGSVMSADGFTHYGEAVYSKPDQFGNIWTKAFNNAPDTSPFVEWSGRVQNNAAVASLIVVGAHLLSLAGNDMTIHAQAEWEPQSSQPTTDVRLFKDVASGAYVQTQFQANPFLAGSVGFLAISAATNGVLKTLASVSIDAGPSGFHLSFNEQLLLTLRIKGEQAMVNMSKADGKPVYPAGASKAFASLGVTSPAVGGRGAPAMALTNWPNSELESNGGPNLSAWEVNGLGSSNLEPFDSYRFDGPNADVYRTASSGVFAGQKLMSVQRGAFPKAAPSTSSIAVICMPFDQGVANDLVSAVVSVRERFFYAR